MAELDFSKIRFGATAWSYYDPNPGNIEGFRKAAEEIRNLPFPDKDGAERYIEVLNILPSNDYHTELMRQSSEMKKIADDKNLRVIITGFVPNILGAASLGSCVTQERNEAAVLINYRGIESATLFERDGYSILGGPIQLIHEKFPEEVPSRKEMEDMEKGFVETAREKIAPYAKEYRVKVSFEGLNRHESFLVMQPGDVADRLISAIDSPWIGLMADTIHYAQEGKGSYMNSISNSVKSGKVFNLHLCEHNRKLFGTGDISYRVRDLFEKVTEAMPENSVLYTGPENFAHGLHRNLRIWRPDELSLSEVVKYGALYLKEKLSN